MAAPTQGTRLGGSPAHQKLILANLATSLFEKGKISEMLDNMINKCQEIIDKI